jgi:hypothetical protein
VAALLALLLAADTLRFKAQGVPELGESGSLYQLHTALVGAYLWLGSLLVAVGGAAVGCALARRDPGRWAGPGVPPPWAGLAAVGPRPRAALGLGLCAAAALWGLAWASATGATDGVLAAGGAALVGLIYVHRLRRRD